MAHHKKIWGSATIVAIAAAGVIILVMDHPAEGAADPELEPFAERARAPSPAGQADGAPRRKAAPKAEPVVDKASARQDARERIAEAIERRSASAAPARQSAAPRDPSPPPDAREPSPPTLDKDYIQELIRDDFVPLAKECYDNALERDPELGGRMTFQFTILGDESVGGIVEDASLTDDSDLLDPDTVECVRESLMSVVFDPPQGGGTVQVTYPFVFTTEDLSG